MSKHPCGWCHKPFNSVREAMTHAKGCPEFRRRLNDLPMFISAKVHRGGLKLEAAEREAAEFRKAHPPLKLD